jgi:hypothetical protein
VKSSLLFARGFVTGWSLLAMTACANGAVGAAFGGSAEAGESDSAPSYVAPSADAGEDARSGSDSAGGLDAAAMLDSVSSFDTAAPSVDSSQAAPDSTIETPAEDSAVVLADSSSSDTGADVGSDAPTGALNPDLALPNASGVPCSTPGSENGCPAIEVCRIDSPTGGRCEGCTSCNNLWKPCVQSSDCDIIFQCFEGQCTPICPLGTSYCGPVQSCLDVGNETYGVCLPQQ